MRTWNVNIPEPKRGLGVEVKIFDTRTQALQAVTPVAADAAVKLYTCGITPYDSTHFGHAATYHTADLLRRVLLDEGYVVEAAQNITDVDDPLLERATQTEVDWRELAAEQETLFSADMQALQVLPPQSYWFVSEKMTQVIALVEKLATEGLAYQVETPDAVGNDWYLDLRQLNAGAGIYMPDLFSEVDLGGDVKAIFSERGGDPERPGKRDPYDPLLWRAERPGEPAWDSSRLGRGRNGWHISCVAVANDSFGVNFDVQIGGTDLIFPHHEMCDHIAKALGQPAWARYYAHVGMVHLDGEKMSKSLGNLVFVSKLLAAGHEAPALRLLLLSQHYRSDWAYSDQLLAAAEERLTKYRVAAQKHPESALVCKQIRLALRDDLNAPAALQVLDAWADGEYATPDETLDATEVVNVPELLADLLGVHL